MTVHAVVRAVLVLGVTLALALLTIEVLHRLLMQLGRRRADVVLVPLALRFHGPARLALATLALLLVLPAAHLPPDAEGPVHHALVLGLIAGVSWLFVRLVTAVGDVAMSQLNVDVPDNRRVRKRRTQVVVSRRVSGVAVTVVALASMLMTFSQARAFGTSLLASAGVIAAIVGFAAQTTLGNVLAGLQIAFSDALRLDDVVVVQGEWGRVEEISLTHVVLHLWDERRLVLPVSYFTQNPFENWTQHEARVVGTVLLYLDFSVPVDEVRREAQRLIEASPLWDRRDWVVQVVDTTPTTMVVRVLASAADAPSAFDLRCDVREKLIGWLAEHYPHALPRLRVGPGGGDALQELVEQTPGAQVVDLRNPAGHEQPRR